MGCRHGAAFLGLRQPALELYLAASNRTVIYWGTLGSKVLQTLVFQFAMFDRDTERGALVD